MSIDSTSSSIHCKKALKSSLSDNNHNYPYSRHSLKDCQNRTIVKSRTMSVCEEASGDLLTELSSLPFSSSKPINNKCNRRFSELKPSLMQQNPSLHSERRNSSPQISLGLLLPNPFRSKKHNHKHQSKDDTHTSVNTFNKNYSLHHNGMMTMKLEQPLPPKSLNIFQNDLRTNSTISNDRLSPSVKDDSTSSISSLSLFTFQTNQYVPCSAENLELELHTSLCIGEIYREYFYEYFHVNYYGELENDGAFLASIRYFNNKTDNNNITLDTTTTQSQARALIRTSTRNYDVSIALDGINEENILQILFNKAELSTIHNYKPIGDPKANEKIYAFDKSNDERQNCKIGVIYQGTEQTNEYDIFSNDGLSDQMLKFMKILAEPIRLKGFNKFRGDLDVKDNLHGSESYYTKYNNHEIMFNIAPIIPSTKANGQCIERKSLVGNSFVCIVFQEPDIEFQPDFISGKVTQIYITVKPYPIEEQLYYKIGIWHRNDFTTSIDPTGGIYKCDESFRDYFLTLLLNSIVAAIESPNLRFRVVEQRQRLKQQEFKKLLQNLSIGQILDLTNEIEDTNSHPLKHTNSRTDSMSSLVVQSTSESIASNSGRVSPVSTKKGRILKIFGALTGRSSSISSTSSATSLLVNSTSTNSNDFNTTQQSRTTQTSNKENDKRHLSIKYHRAPPPPPRVTSQPAFSQLTSVGTQPNTYNSQPTSSLTPSSQSIDALNESLFKENMTINTNVFEEPSRCRSNSSPDDIPVTSKTFLSNVSQIKEEVDSTSSSLDNENENDELTEDDKFEHRQTLTEPPLILPPVTSFFSACDDAQ